MSANLYTQEQLDIALVKQQSETMTQTLNRIECKLDKLETKMDSELTSIDKKVDSHFKWILGIIGAVGLAILAATLPHWFK